jgi:hypothetical protein
MLATGSDPKLPFSQRTGLEPLPPQLRLGEVSAELRRLLSYCISQEIDRHTLSGYSDPYLKDGWERVANDLHVKFYKRDPETFQNEPYTIKRSLNSSTKEFKLGKLFDLIEFLLQHRGCSKQLKDDLSEAFVSARAAYRIIDNSIIAAVGSEEQASSLERALAESAQENATAVRKQLIAAGIALKQGAWAASIRESTHAVEAMAVKLAPETKTLGGALAVLESRGHLHGSLKKAFGALYGYSSDEEGVRHALVFQETAQVDEVDALFMLGACAAFVSYLIARNRTA